MSRAAGGRATSAAAVLMTSLALSACGSATKSGRGTAKATSARSTPSLPLATFTCDQWRVSPESLRAEVVRELHGFYGAAVSGQRKTQAYGTVLRDAEARRLFDSYCRAPYARNFTLYKLYARATAFNGGAP